MSQDLPALRKRRLCVVLGIARGAHSGFRTLRIIRAVADKHGTCKQIVAAAFSSLTGRWNGRRLKLSRDEFCNPHYSCVGIPIGHGRIVPVDEYVRRKTMSTAKNRAEEDMSQYMLPAQEAPNTPVPLCRQQRYIRLLPTEVSALAARLRDDPALLRQNLPREPEWTLRLPDKSVLELTGYGSATTAVNRRAAIASTMLITGWRDPEDDEVYQHNTIPVRAADSVRALLATAPVTRRKRQEQPAEPPVAAAQTVEEVQPARPTPQPAALPEEPTPIDDLDTAFDIPESLDGPA